MPDMRFLEHLAVYWIGVECLLRKTAGVYHSHIFLLQFEQLFQLIRLYQKLIFKIAVFNNQKFLFIYFNDDDGSIALVSL